MADKIIENNQVSIMGQIISQFTFSHQVFGEGFYLIDVLVKRLSDSEDRIPVMISERLIDVTQDYEGEYIPVSYTDLDVYKRQQYIRVYALCSPVTTIVFAMDNYLRICGRIRYSMVLNILMSGLSAGLEFLFLYVFRFGIWGAALGTCLGMSVCAVLAFAPFAKGRMQLRFGRPKMSGAVLKSILTNGCPSFLNNLAGRITSIVMNIFLLRLGGAAAVSVYGVLMYVDGFVQPLLYGMCDSLQPAVGYNWGCLLYTSGPSPGRTHR